MLEYRNICLRMMSFCMREVKVAWFAYPRFTCGFAGGGKYSYYVLVIFFTLPGFSYVVSAFDYSLLKHVVINDDL